MPTDWNANQMREFLFSIFIPLRGYSYKLCFSSVGGNLENIPSDCDTPKKLKTFFSSFRRTAGKVFIRPDRYITTTPQVYRYIYYKFVYFTDKFDSFRDSHMLNYIFEGREKTADSKKHIARLFLGSLKTDIVCYCYVM